MSSQEFITVVDLYDDRDIKDGEGNIVGVEQYLLKGNIKIKSMISLSDIKRYGEVLTEKGNIKKGYTKLYLDAGSEVVVKGHYSDIGKLLTTNKIGFKYGR